MAYCAVTDVKVLIDTDLTDNQITSIIALADNELDQLLGGASMTATQKKTCSMMLSAIMIAQRQPRKESLAGASLDWSGRITEWQRYVKQAVSRAVGRWTTIDSLSK